MNTPGHFWTNWARPLVEILALSLEKDILACLPEELVSEVVGQSCAAVFGPLGAGCATCSGEPSEQASEPKAEGTVGCVPLAGGRGARLHVALRPEASRRLTELLSRLDLSSRHTVAFLLHDLNNLLAALGGAVAHLAKRTDLPEAAREDVREVQTLATAALRLLQRFHPTATRTSRSAADLAEAMDLAQRICRLALIESGAQLVASPPAEPVLVAADPTALTQMLTNLLLNAIQAAAEGPREPMIRLEAETQDTEVVVAVTDNGPGIPKDIQARIFEPFFTTRTGGSGLGLALVQRLAEENNVRLRFNSSPRGTRFELILQKALEQRA